MFNTGPIPLNSMHELWKASIIVDPADKQKPATPIMRLIPRITEATNKFLSTRW